MSWHKANLFFFFLIEPKAALEGKVSFLGKETEAERRQGIPSTSWLLVGHLQSWSVGLPPPSEAQLLVEEEALISSGMEVE